MAQTAGNLFAFLGGRNQNFVFRILCPGVLLCLGLLGINAPEPSILSFEVLAGALVAVFTLVLLVSGAVELRISRLLGAGLLEGYAVGSVPTVWSAYVKHDLASDLLGSGSKTFALALCQIFCGVALLFFVGELTEPALRLTKPSPQAQVRLNRFVWFGTIVLLVAFVHGDLTYMGGAAVGGETKISLFGNLAVWTLAPCIGATATLLALADRPVQRFAYGTLIGLQIITAAPLGRRTFLYDLLLAFLIYNFWRPYLQKAAWKLFLGLIVGGVLVSVSWTAFLYLRVASYTYEEGEHYRLAELMERAFSLYQHTETSAFQAAWQDQDVSARVDLISYDSLLLDAVRSSRPAYGGGAWNEFKWVVPSALWPNKTILAEEEYASGMFGISIPDSPNSVMTAATIDFGFWGGLVYPLLASWLLAFCARLAWRLFPSPFPHIYTFAVIVYALQVEGELSIYFDAARELFIYGVAYTLLLLAISFSWDIGRSRLGASPRSIPLTTKTGSHE